MMEKDELIFPALQNLWLNPESNSFCDFWHMLVPQVFNILNVDMSDKIPCPALIFSCDSALACGLHVDVDWNGWGRYFFTIVEMFV